MDNSKNQVTAILENELKGKAFEYSVIPSYEIVFSPDVIKACKANHCGRYNTCWTCPPALGDLSFLRKKYTSYNRVFVFTTKSDLQDSFDIEGMDSARKKHISIEEAALKKLEGFDIACLTAGSCGICGKCTYPGSPCVFPEKARPSIEAVGIDVTQLAKACNIKYYNGENTVTYFSAIFF